MFTKNQFPFDAEAMAEFFKTNDFTKMFSGTTMPNVDTNAMMAAQKANMDALVEANKAAAAGFQDMFKKQVSLFEEAMEEAKKTLAEFDVSKMTPEAAQAQGAVMQAAYEKAIAHMSELTETAKKANTEAYEIVAARMKDSMAELKDMADKAAK
ncbi:phasin family protein [Rubricella aquisinus]|uniref:Phasin family protein n=1 Tax=Rubricella aquisinus TaxID=2028108 RepID=A0A840X4R1_9RHOB|nr:phasin family protein [Rubricella aquisinus]MBB5516825.1 phasin family protein [Rubricella aquisinus]